MPQRVVDRRFQISDFFAGIVTAAFENVSVEVALPDQSPHRARAFDASQERLRAAAEAGNTYVKFAQRKSA